MSLIQLIKLICEDLIPYYSTHSSTKQVMNYRVADSKVKSDSKLLKDSSFHQPITENLLFSCTCRWNMADDTYYK